MPQIKAEEPRAETCAEAFNNAWECYSPTFQMTQYYRYGELDTCNGRWEAIWACMDKSKRNDRALSSRAPVNEQEQPQKARPYWTLLGPKEAGKLWRVNFGDKVPTDEELAVRKGAI